jgi:lipoate-protein ligase A
MLYRNEPSIIIGKHQNALAEINLDFVRKNNIRVVRRISGGGAVYHDQGNLNYSIIRNGEAGRLVDFARHTRPVTGFLSALGLQVLDDGRNSLLLNGRKISGNAEHVYRSRVLHHGTLLFSSALDKLTEALKANPDRYSDRAIRSVRSEVTNLADHLDPTMTIESFADRLFRFVMDFFGDTGVYEFTGGDLEEINQLAADKYRSWEWTYGYSPSYTLEREIMLSGISVILTLGVEHGRISRVSLAPETAGRVTQETLSQALRGLPHSWDRVYERLREVMTGTGDEEIGQIISGFF